MHILLTSNPQTSFKFYHLSQQCPSQPKGPIQNYELHLVVTFVSFHLKQFLCLSLTFVILALLKIIGQLFWVVSFPVGFPYDQIQVIHLWQEHHRSGTVLLYPLIWAAVLVCPITDDFTLIPGLRWRLPGFFTVKTFSPLVINNYLCGQVVCCSQSLSNFQFIHFLYQHKIMTFSLIQRVKTHDYQSSLQWPLVLFSW